MGHVRNYHSQLEMARHVISRGETTSSGTYFSQAAGTDQKKPSNNSQLVSSPLSTTTWTRSMNQRSRLFLKQRNTSKRSETSAETAGLLRFVFFHFDREPSKFRENHMTEKCTFGRLKSTSSCSLQDSTSRFTKIISGSGASTK